MHYTSEMCNEGDKIYKDIPYNKIGQDINKAITNAHPAAKAVLVASGAQVALGAVSVAEGAYTVVYTNPISAYNAATAALDGGWSASVLGITSWAGRVGQGLSKVIEWIAN